jgi:hypothetical protein
MLVCLDAGHEVASKKSTVDSRDVHDHTVHSDGSRAVDTIRELARKTEARGVTLESTFAHFDKVGNVNSIHILKHNCCFILQHCQVADLLIVQLVLEMQQYIRVSDAVQMHFIEFLATYVARTYHHVAILTLHCGIHYCSSNYYYQNGNGRITARELYKGLEDLGILDVLSRDELEDAMEVLLYMISHSISTGITADHIIIFM